MRKQILIGLLLATPLLAQPVLADEHRDHERHVEHRDHWRGDIHSFHERDMARWRSGYWHRGRHDGRLGWWWVAAGAWYFYPAPVYPYPDPYQPPVVMVERPAPAPIQAPPPSSPPQAAATQYWYYCQNPQGYYPYVAQCPTPWKKVPASPPPAAR